MWIKYTKIGRMCETSAYATKSTHMFENGRISDYSRHFNFNVRPPKFRIMRIFAYAWKLYLGRYLSADQPNRRTLGFTEKLHL